MFIYFVSNDIMKWISLNETQLKNHFVLDIKRETFFWALLHLVGSGGICAEILLIICWRHILNFPYTKCEQRRFESSLNSCGCRWANERNLFCHDITANQNACRSTYDLYVSFLTAQKKRKKLWKPSNWRSSLVREFFVLKWWETTKCKFHASVFFFLVLFLLDNHHILTHDKKKFTGKKMVTIYGK